MVECINEPIYYEHKGLALVTADKLRIVPMNYSDYRKNDVYVQFTITGDTEICVEKKGKRDRNVEAYKILLARNAVICFDLDKHLLREYKITRFDEVVITEKNWRNYKQKYNNSRIDLFDMLEGNGTACNIVLKLAQLPYNLLLEECNGAEHYITANNDDEREQFL